MTKRAEKIDPAACKILWSEVLLLGLRDIQKGRTARRRTAGVIDEAIRAIRWIGTGDFIEVCQLAGLSHDRLLPAYKREAAETIKYLMRKSWLENYIELVDVINK